MHTDNLNLPQFDLSGYHQDECKEEYKYGNVWRYTVLVVVLGPPVRFRT